MISPHDISDFEFYIIHTTPWIDKLSPVYVKDAPLEAFNEVPVLRQARRLLEMMKENGDKLKLTPSGRLPRPIVKELYEIGVHNRFNDDFYKSIDSETKAPNVLSMRLLMEVAGFVRRRNNFLHIVKKNAALTENPKTMLEKLLNTYSTDYNIGYFDAYSKYEIPDINYESALMYMFVANYGDIWRGVSFYKNELVAIQHFLSECPQDKLTDCIDCRIFRRQMMELGFIEREEGSWLKNEEAKIKRTPLFDTLIGVRTPETPIVFHSNSIMS